MPAASQGDYTYSQKQALQEELDLLFAGSTPFHNARNKPVNWSCNSRSASDGGEPDD